MPRLPPAAAGAAVLVLDSNARVGDNWRRHWDTLRLYSPAKYDGLPGMPFPADPWSFPQKDEVAAFLESYALTFDLPVRMSTRVDALEQRADGGFELSIGGDTITCDNVVVATGTFGQTPNIPDFGHQLDPTVRQLHSSEYHRPDDLQPGPVLVVGASHSGTDIAYEAARTHPVTLCGRDPGQLPFRPEQRRAKLIFPVVVFAWRARPHPAYPDRTQGVPRGARARRPDDPGPPRGPRRARRRAAHCPHGRCPATACRCSTTAPSCRSPTSSGQPASARSSTGSSFR